jgi:hypothetical protein
MGRYGEQIGFHSPQMSEDSKIKLDEMCPKAELWDSSWHNDACDSLTHNIDEDKGDYYQIYLPNSTEDEVDNECKFNTFTLSLCKDFAFERNLIEEGTLEEVAKKLNELIN